MVKPEFIIKTMRQNNIRFFDVYDAEFKRQTEQLAPIGVEEAITRFEDFLEGSCSGYYRVNIYKTNETKADGTPKGKAFSYEMYLDDSNKPKPMQEPVTPVAPEPQQTIGGIREPMQDVFMGNTNMMGGVALNQYLAEKDTILNLRLEIQKLQMENKYLLDKMERREAELRSEIDKQSASETRINGIINQVLPTLMTGFAGQSPMNGIPTAMSSNNHNPSNAANTEKQQIIESVNRLMKVDPNFAKNIAALAALAEKKPDVYDMAVKYLNGL
jgi:hypothetical protein